MNTMEGKEYMIIKNDDESISFYDLSIEEDKEKYLKLMREIRLGKILDKK